ncbi:MAG: hypothetical protein HFG56_04690 [Lachnospiraceae bacterium]|nr:hypothetical protein [Lachnospiraceae bacterium]
MVSEFKKENKKQEGCCPINGNQSMALMGQHPFKQSHLDKGTKPEKGTENFPLLISPFPWRTFCHCFSKYIIF